MTATRGYSYIVLVPNLNPPILLADLKEHLRIPASDTSQDNYLTFLIYAIAAFVEKYTHGVILLETLFRTYRDFFVDIIKPRRSRLILIDAFKYSVDDVFQTVDSSLYYATDENGYSKIVLRNGMEYPTDIDIKLDSIKIDFKAGFGGDYQSIPRDLYLAMMQHIAKVYENRGDCDEDMTKANAFDVLVRALPSETKMIYDLYQINDLVGDGYM